MKEKIMRLIGHMPEDHAEALAGWMEKFKIDTPRRCAMFLAQCGHECDDGRTFEEYASGAAYEGRSDLGNHYAGDGTRFKGRGAIQLTGRRNYKKLTAYLRDVLDGVDDFEIHPEMVASAQYSGLAACWFWRFGNGDLNRYADAGDFDACTVRINGGFNGKGDRDRRYALALREFGLEAPAPSRVLRKGSSGPDVLHLQSLLKKHGYVILLDGDFGPATDEAVMDFQRKAGLAIDGIVGPVTLKALEAVPAWTR